MITEIVAYITRSLQSIGSGLSPEEQAQAIRLLKKLGLAAQDSYDHQE